ncbi:MAG: hypothetical protein ACQEWW_13385 [Bacillota bacterium]
MLQQSLLLNFKIKVNETKNYTTPMNYNFFKGIWEFQEGSPFVNVVIKNHSQDYGATLVTATREGIDRSERS